MKNFSLILLCLFLVFNTSCNKDETNDTPSVSNTYSITLAGQINDENGQGIPNVTVQVGNKTDQTDGNGIYLIEKANVNKSRAVVKATKAGYWSRSSGFIPSNSTVQYCNFVMPQNTILMGVQGSTGGSISNLGATIVFPPNAFVNSTGVLFSGTVFIASKHLATTDPNFKALIPGGDLMAEDTTGNSVKLVSFGMIGIELKDNNGNALQLAPGITATIQLPIASTQLASAPTTIPLWYFDETKNLWIEDGLANKVGNNYVGEVEHFSWWNYDQPGQPATIEGYVVDCDGNPLQNAVIFNDNNGYLYTNQNGYYSGQIVSGSVSSLKAQYAGIFTNTISIPALNAGQVYVVPNLTFNCSGLGLLKANFVGCNNTVLNPPVYISTPSGNIMVIPKNGEIRTYVPCGSNTLVINFFGVPYVNSYTQPCYPDSINLGTIIICDTTTTTPGLLFHYDMTSTFSNLFYQNAMYVIGEYDSTANVLHFATYNPITTETFDCNLSSLPAYQVGTYTFPSMTLPILDIDYSSPNVSYIVYNDQGTPNLSVSIIRNGAVGDTMEVMINGNILINSNLSGAVENGVLNSLYVKCIRTQ